MRSTHYNSPIDTWACGCIMSELFALSPLFPGTSEADQIYKICSVLGTPTAETWPEGLKLAGQMGFRYPPFVPTPLAQIVPNASYEALALLSDLIQFDPYRRPTASQALQYPFFQASSTLAPVTTKSSDGGAHKHGFQPQGEGEAVPALGRKASVSNSFQGGGGGGGAAVAGFGPVSCLLWSYFGISVPWGSLCVLSMRHDLLCDCSYDPRACVMSSPLV